MEKKGTKEEVDSDKQSSLYDGAMAPSRGHSGRRYFTFYFHSQTMVYFVDRFLLLCWTNLPIVLYFSGICILLHIRFYTLKLNQYCLLLFFLSGAI